MAQIEPMNVPSRDQLAQRAAMARLKIKFRWRFRLYCQRWQISLSNKRQRYTMDDLFLHPRWPSYSSTTLEKLSSSVAFCYLLRLSNTIRRWFVLFKRTHFAKVSVVAGYAMRMKWREILIYESVIHFPDLLECRDHASAHFCYDRGLSREKTK